MSKVKHYTLDVFHHTYIQVHYVTLPNIPPLNNVLLFHKKESNAARCLKNVSTGGLGLIGFFWRRIWRISVRKGWTGSIYPWQYYPGCSSKKNLIQAWSEMAYCLGVTCDALVLRLCRIEIHMARTLVGVRSSLWYAGSFHPRKKLRYTK